MTKAEAASEARAVPTLDTTVDVSLMATVVAPKPVKKKMVRCASAPARRGRLEPHKHAFSVSPRFKAKEIPFSAGPGSYEVKKNQHKHSGLGWGTSSRFPQDKREEKPRPKEKKAPTYTQGKRTKRPASATTTRQVKMTADQRHRLTPGPIYDIQNRTDHKSKTAGKFEKGRRDPHSRVGDPTPEYKYNRIDGPRSKTGGKAGKNERFRWIVAKNTNNFGCKYNPKSFADRGAATSARNNARSFGTAPRFKSDSHSSNPAPCHYNPKDVRRTKGSNIAIGKEKKGGVPMTEADEHGPNYNNTIVGSKYAWGPTTDSHAARFSKGERFDLATSTKRKGKKKGSKGCDFNPKTFAPHTNGARNFSNVISWGKDGAKRDRFNEGPSAYID